MRDLGRSGQEELIGQWSWIKVICNGFRGEGSRLKRHEHTPSEDY